MIKQEMKKLLEIREKADNEWEEELKRIWAMEIDVLLRNINETIEYFDCQCSDDDFTLCSEVFDDIARETDSIELIKCIYRRTSKIKNYKDKKLLYRFLDFTYHCLSEENKKLWPMPSEDDIVGSKDNS